MCARRRSPFLCLAKERNQRKATPLDVSLHFVAGNLRCSVLGRRCGTRFVRCAHAARTAAASQFTKHGHAALPAPAPGPALLGTARGVGQSARAIAALGPVVGAIAALGLGFGCSGAERSDGPNEKPFWMRRGAQRVGCAGAPQDAPATCSGSPRLFERSAQRVVSSAAAPRTRAPQVARSAAKGRSRQGRLSFAYFSLAKQRKVGRPPGRIPGQRCIQRQQPLTPAPVQAGGRLLSPEGRGSKTAGAARRIQTHGAGARVAYWRQSQSSGTMPCPSSEPC